MMKKWTVLLIIFAILHITIQACDMSAVIFKRGTVLADFYTTITTPNFSDYNVPNDYLAYVISRSQSAVNNDGYGILYYAQDDYQLTEDNYWYKYVHSASEANHIYYNGNYFVSINAPDVFDVALGKMSKPDAKASIIMCHSRNASTNPFAPGNHPFRMDVNNRTYSLMHNGFMSETARTFMINEINILDTDWFAMHSPNFIDFDLALYPSCWIDSEVLFNYLMCHITACDYDVYTGMRLGLIKLANFMKLSTNVVNFVFSDGQNLYTFRSTPLSGVNSNYKLNFKYNGRGFWGIRTGAPITEETQVDCKELVVFTNDGLIERYPNFLNVISNLSYRSTNGNPGIQTRITGTVVHPDFIGINISFTLSEPSRVKLNIYNLKGQLVSRITDKYLNTGVYTLNWNGRDTKGRLSAQGIYYLEMKKGNQRSVTKVVYRR